MSSSPFRFVRGQVHPAFADIQGWFLEVRRDDAELITALHKSIAAKYGSMLGQESHGWGDKRNNAAMLASLWLQSLEEELTFGEVLVNAAGGLVAKRDLIVLAEIESDEPIWPDHLPDEIITISKWPKGKHFYLCSNHNRVFMPEKFSTYRAARAAALKYVPSNRIDSRE
jgi:hypothetical protein